ncbi:PEP-CTERM sorting domain-containing protein [Blastopirellula marina]|uniref:Ice-binding protein C-terminal domain-containing protein n=1 Tax=Blastopirellula marina DSM 3645 TaxID=314230 RepID=A3ZP98_9BACT|nr:PEP-CTERM sorting domain-containing protein [Blastopirellula marina]EAQ81576.1 hypothetical protein DSM3645_28382 [Blastopirellula marina DSM 3645]
MKLCRWICLFITMWIAGPVYAETLSIDATADGSSRWSEYFSDAFVQLDHQPGSYLISEYEADGSYVPVGDGSQIAFLNDGDFNSFFDIEFTAPAGRSGTVAIDAFTADFDDFIADDDAIFNTGYATTINSFTGTATFVGGVISQIDLLADIMLTYDASGFGLGMLDYAGTFAITGAEFALFADGSYETGFTPARYVWDVTGTLDLPEPPTATPEPGSLLLAVVGGVGLLTFRRRRKRVTAE